MPPELQKLAYRAVMGLTGATSSGVLVPLADTEVTDLCSKLELADSFRAWASGLSPVESAVQLSALRPASAQLAVLA